MKNTAVHGTAAALGRVEPGAEPLEIRSVATIYFDIDETGGRDLQGVFGLAFDGFGQLFRGDLSEREVHAGEVLAVKGVELGIVGGAMLRAEPPAPVAALRG